jgi:hypothetical protein
VIGRVNHEVHDSRTVEPAENGPRLHRSISEFSEAADKGLGAPPRFHPAERAPIVAAPPGSYARFAGLGSDRGNGALEPSVRKKVELLDFVDGTLLMTRERSDGGPVALECTLVEKAESSLAFCDAAGRKDFRDLLVAVSVVNEDFPARGGGLRSTELVEKLNLPIVAVDEVEVPKKAWLALEDELG